MFNSSISYQKHTFKIAFYLFHILKFICKYILSSSLVHLKNTKIETGQTQLKHVLQSGNSIKVSRAWNGER